MNPTATIETERGVIRVELFPEDAPKTVENFLTLAKKGYYDGLMFHRVIPNFVAQTGDPNSRNARPGDPGLGGGGPGYTIPDEATPNRKHERGALGMAKTAAPNSAGSQFYIVIGKPAPHLDGGYTVFGRVLEGQDAAEKLTVGDRIVKVTVQDQQAQGQAQQERGSRIMEGEASLVRMVAPNLKDISRKSADRSTLKARFTISAEGRGEVELVEGTGNAELDRAVLDALRRWQWKPAAREGKTVKSVQEITIELP